MFDHRSDRFDVVVVGGGVCGASAAIVAASAGHRVALVDASGVGGRLLNLAAIADDPLLTGDLLNGSLLAAHLLESAMDLGIEVTFDRAGAIVGAAPDFTVTCQGSSPLTARAVVLATGHTDGTFGLPDEDALRGRGVSHCASCDGPLYQGQRVAVAGNSDWAVDEAVHLAEYVEHVDLVVPDGVLACTPARAARVRGVANISVHYDRVVTGIRTTENRVAAIALVAPNGGEPSELAVTGAFPMQGWRPDTASAPSSLALGPDGVVATDQSTATEVVGLFAAGDVTRRAPGYVAEAAAEGVRAGRAASGYLAR